MKTAAALILYLLTTVAAVAGPDRISVLGGSKHIGASETFNGINPGLFLTWEDRAFGLDYTFGAYLNSYRKPSVAATAALPVIEWSDGEISLFAGAAYYPDDGRTFGVHAGDLVPVGGIQIRQKNMFMQVIPSDGVFVDAIVSVGFTFSTGD